MHRPGADMENAGPEDFLCDYCHHHWSDDRPMVEGHRGSLICGKCLTVAYREVVLGGGGVGPSSGAACALCLQTNPTRHWVSPLDENVLACVSCIEKSARMLAKDPDSDWTPPTA